MGDSGVRALILVSLLLLAGGAVAWGACLTAAELFGRWWR